MTDEQKQKIKRLSRRILQKILYRKKVSHKRV